jgi:hypothetical protein
MNPKVSGGELCRKFVQEFPGFINIAVHQEENGRNKPIETFGSILLQAI